LSCGREDSSEVRRTKERDGEGERGTNVRNTQTQSNRSVRGNELEEDGEDVEERLVGRVVDRAPFNDADQPEGET